MISVGTSPSRERAIALPWREGVCWAVVAVGAALLLYRSLTPGVTGLFHDDAIYTSVARSLAEGGGYHLASVPGTPPQTKYPPLLSGLLAIVWWLHPAFPENVVWLKSLNLLFLGAALWSMAWLVRAQHPGAGWAVPIACQIALATNPSVVTFVDFTMSDVPFAALAVCVMALWARSGDPATRGREVTIVAVTAGAILLRSVGVTLLLAMALDSLLARTWRRAMLHGACGAMVLVAWFAWASTSRAPGSPLTAYYLEYERSALAYVVTNPSLSLEIVWGNVRWANDAMLLVFGPLWAVASPLLAALAAIGCVGLWRARWRMPVLFGACYSSVAALHPWMPTRYLLPLVPVFLLAVVAGVAVAWRLVDRVRPARVSVRTAPALVVIALLLAGNVVWLRHQFRPGQQLRGWYGLDMGFGWSGVEETFAWIRANTPSDARLGGIFDPMYFLYTGRQAVRPWFHHPETYFYPYGHAAPFVGEAADVVRELRRLDIDYLVFDPPAGYSEGPAAIALLREIVTQPDVGARLVFRSTDGQHEIYRLWRQDAQ